MYKNYFVVYVQTTSIEPNEPYVWIEQNQVRCACIMHGNNNNKKKKNNNNNNQYCTQWSQESKTKVMEWSE